MRLVAAVRQAAAREFLIILLLCFSINCNEDDNKADEPENKRGSSRVLVATQFFTQYDDIVQQKAAEAVYREFTRVGIDLTYSLITSVEAPPPPEDYFHRSTCDSFYTDGDTALALCGRRNMLGAYAYYYRTGPMKNRSINDVLFHVEPAAGSYGRATPGAGVWHPAAFESSDYTEGSYIFKNQVEQALTDNGLPYGFNTTYETRLVGRTAAHELGHQMHLEHANYDENDDTNVYHCMTCFARCLMTTRFQRDDIIADSSLHFCADFISDQNDSNSCRDNLERRFGL